MVRLILRNLIANAIKFFLSGHKILIKSFKVAENIAKIWIEDSGVRMTVETIERLFNKETLYSTVGTKKEQGTGLGLILSQKYVEKHNGKIWIDSELGKGSTFKINLPVPI